ncbi:MAG: hypothetical protein EA382_17595, partial [Spirochaetaceae bacterium]
MRRSQPKFGRRRPAAPAAAVRMALSPGTVRAILWSLYLEVIMKLVLKSTGLRLVSVLAVVVVLAAVTTGCGRPGDDGSTYLAIDWVYAPQALLFPAFPQTIYAGRYVEHQAGTYTGEYIAWDGSYWNADYWIAIDPGGEAPLFGTGDHGDDYYLSLWLYSSGPSITTDSIEVRSIAAPNADARAAAPPSAASSATPTFSNTTLPAPAIVAARERAAGSTPIVV